MPELDFSIGGDLVDPRLKQALQFKRLDHYIFTHDINYMRQMGILRNAMLLGVISKTEGLEMKVQAMIDAYARVKFLSKETAEKTLWAEWEEFGKLKDEVVKVLRKKERKWEELEHKLGFEDKKKKN